MRFLILSAVILGFSSVYPQDHLDPANYPSYGSPAWCDTTGKVAAYRDIYRGINPYSVGLGRQIPGTGTSVSNPARYYSPVIDGILEDSIWFYAETLLINSWEVSGYDACCNAVGPPDFYGAKDLHAIWRFFYNHDGLYVGCEVHDDVHDVDSLGGWYDQDAVEISIDPWDWGDFAAGHWNYDEFRRYVSGNLVPSYYIMIPSGCIWTTDYSQLHYMRIIKRLNEEPFVAGLIRGEVLANFNFGDEATNFTKGSPKTYGLDFAVASMGIDPYFRSIHHVEFKFPYNDPTAWTDLRSMGFYDTANGLPKTGNLFKMSFTNNDDDMPGPDGDNPNNTYASSWRADPFFMEEPAGHDHWSDTKYYPAFKYEARTISKVHITTSCCVFGDGRISGLWVDAATEQNRYAFLADGYVTFLDQSFYYDSSDNEGGKFYNAARDSVGFYSIGFKTPGRRMNDDTLIVHVNGAEYVLNPYMGFGNLDVLGRWVEVKNTPDTIKATSLECGDLYCFRFKPNALEYRFCPLSKLDTTALPGYAGCVDSLRIYRYQSGDFFSECAFTPNAGVIGRDSILFSYYVTRLIYCENPGAPRHLVVKYTNGDSAIFQEYKPYPLKNLGETGNNINKTMTLLARTPSDSLLKMYVFNKYANSVNLYPDRSLTTSKYRIMIYPDRVLCIDSLKTFSWSSVFDCSIQLDSFELLDYNPTTRIATGLGSKSNSETWPDSAYILQRHIIVFASPASVDTFIFQDTMQVFEWNILRQPYGEIMPWSCRTCNNVDTTDADKSLPVINKLELSNFPNPFNPSTIISFTIPGIRGVERYVVSIFDIRGRLVRTLVKGKAGPAGMNRKVVWDGTDNAGAWAGSGVYYYQLICGKRILKGSMVMVR